jgi:hypothetical protein
LKVAICAIVKDVYQPYWEEWINYHKSIGVDYFFIYDNGSAIPIEHCPDNGIWVMRFVGESMQLPAYDHCLQSIKKEELPPCDRVAFIDEDEFIVCENDDLKRTLKTFGVYAGIGLSWRTFGSSGIMKKNPESQRKKFLWHSGPSDVVNQHIKSIVDPYRAIAVAGDPHHFSFLTGYTINVYREVVPGPFSRCIHRIMWIDHYYTRSWEEWKEKIERGRSDIKDGPRAWENFDVTNSYCKYNVLDEKKRGRTKPRDIHLLIPFYRKENQQALISDYGKMAVKPIIHPIMFEDEAIDWPDEPWIRPSVIPMKSTEVNIPYPGTFKRNWFLRNIEIYDDDFYVCADDDDMYETAVFEEAQWSPEDILIISMKRGNHIPRDAEEVRRYPTSTLFAKPDKVQIREISGQQCFICGRLMRGITLNEMSGVWDGEMIVELNEQRERMGFRSDLYALFNYYEKERWTPPFKIGFGAMVNNENRFDMVLKQSELKGFPLEIITYPDSATRGLNKLLDRMEAKGIEIAVLSHQDVFFRSYWINQMREQIELLPDNWIVAGVIGKDMDGKICGKMQDMRMPIAFNTSHWEPQPASCFDEVIIIVNMKSGFRFDESLPGFDLYGTLAVCQAWEMGGSAWIISAFVEHYCSRSFEWFPNRDFEESFLWLHKRFSKGVAERIDTTVLGVHDSLPRYDDEFDGPEKAVKEEAELRQQTIQYIKAEEAYDKSRGIGPQQIEMSVMHKYTEQGG